MNKLVVETQDELYKKIDEIDEGFASTDVKLERVKLELKLIRHSLRGKKKDEISMLELFNDLVLNDSVPFATISNYFKILKDFIPSEEWRFSQNNSLLLKVSDKETVNVEKLTDYNTVT